MFFLEFKFLIPELYLALLIVLLTISCIIFDNLNFFKGFKLDFVSIHIKLIIFALFFLLVILVNSVNNEFVIFNHLLYGNFATAVTKIVLTVIFLSVFSSLNTYYKNNLKGYEFTLLLLIVQLSLFLIVSSSDFITLFFSFEMLSLTLYVLVAYKRDSIFSTEGGLRYFILGAFTSSLLAIGISFIYYVFGSTNFFTISLVGSLSSDLLISDSFLFYGIIFILVAFFFKLSVFPFHFWTPDVYQGAPIFVTKVLATASKIGLITVLIKLLGDVFSFYNIILNPYLLIGGIGSVLVGTIGSLFQFKLKRLLAYSTISNMGFIIIALSLGTFDGYVSAYFYMLVYVLLNLNLFSIVLSFVKRFTGKIVSDISELNYLGAGYPLIALIFSFVLFSIAGIPPLAGFFSKFYIFYALVYKADFFLVIFLVLMSIVSAGYYLRLINFIYFQGVTKYAFYSNLTYLATLLIGLMFILNITFILFAKPLLQLTNTVIFSLLV